MSKAHVLAATVRSELGRKVKHLRSAGSLPATVYGKGVDGASLTVNADAFDAVFDETGYTGLIELTIGDEKRPVLVHDVQVDPVSDEILHIEFHQVNLKEKVHASVPLTLVGEAPAVVDKVGALLTLLDVVDVEALPTDLPDHIDVDVSGLAELDAEITVQDLKVPAGVTMITEGTVPVVKIGSLVSKEAEAQAAEEAAAAAASAPTEEGAASAEGGAETPAPAAEAKEENAE